MSDASDTPAEHDDAHLEPAEPEIDQPEIDRTGTADRFHDWYRRAQLPLLTVGFFAVFAAVLWLSAIINRYRFNVVLAVLASVPLAALLIRGAAKARVATRAEDTSA